MRQLALQFASPATPPNELQQHSSAADASVTDASALPPTHPPAAPLSTQSQTGSQFRFAPLGAYAPTSPLGVLFRFPPRPSASTVPLLPTPQTLPLTDAPGILASSPSPPMPATATSVITPTSTATILASFPPEQPTWSLSEVSEMLLAPELDYAVLVPGQALTIPEKNAIRSIATNVRSELFTMVLPAAMAAAKAHGRLVSTAWDTRVRTYVN